MMVGGELKTVGQMGHEKRTGEIKNTHKISGGNNEWKMHFGRSRPRRIVTNNVMNWT